MQVANLVYAGELFLIYDEDGSLALTDLTYEGMEIRGRISMSDSHAFTAPTLVGTDLYVRDRRFLTAFDLSPSAVEAVAEGNGQVLRSESPGLPPDVESFLGSFETTTSGREPKQVHVRLEKGWLVLDLPEQAVVRLALGPDGERWEFVEDRTSGSSPRR